MTSFTPVSAAVGGALIGLAVSVLLAGAGRIAGISGILGGALAPRKSESDWRYAFLAGLLAASLVVAFVARASFGAPVTSSLATMAIAGVLVGVGTQLANGCTSGHGVAGLARLSKRSFVATGVFMLTAMITVFLVRRLGGA